MGASVSSGDGGRLCGSIACGYERPKVTGTPDGNTAGGPLNTQVVVVVHDNMGNLVVQPRPNGTISIGTDKSKSTVQLNRPPSLLFKSDGYVAGPAGSEKYKKLEEDDVGGVGGAPDDDDFKGDPERSPNPSELRPRGGTQDSVPVATPASTDDSDHADDYSEKAYTPRSHFTSEPGSPRSRVGGADEMDDERKELLGTEELPRPTEQPSESIAAVNASLTALLQTVSLTQSAYEPPEPKSILANFSAQARGILQSSDDKDASKPDITRAATLGAPSSGQGQDDAVPRTISLPETSKEDARIMRQNRSKIQRDFVDAEKAYHDGLGVLTKQYLRPLQNSGERMFLGVTPQQVQDIFGNVETIAKLHDNIYYDLLDDPTSIVDAVAQCAPEFVAYRTYAENFPKCLEALHQLSENKKFLQFLKLKAMSSTNTTFMTYLLMPLERISQYDKSLSGLFQHLPDSDPQKGALANILLSVKSVSTDVARYKTQADNLAQLLDISNAIVKMTNPLQNAGPRYNKKGILKLISSRGTEVANSPEYTFVLFPDWLMWTDHRNKMRFVDQVELKGVGYGVRSGSGDEASAPVRFDLYLTADESSRMCAECPSAADCLEWMTALQRNIDNLKPTSLI